MANTRNCKLKRGDFISSLPDDILLDILSKVTIKEQARTGVLSSRWTHLSHMWALNSCLNLDAGDFVQSEADIRIKTSKFINTVDQILRMHRGQVIDQLKITFPIDNTVEFPDSLKVYRWFHIAKQKQVKDLYLNYYSYNHFSTLSFGSTTFSSLVTLCLENTFITDHIVHCLLSNSPNLLKLSIINCYSLLIRLKISGSSLKLNHLELISNATMSFEISAPNLVSFTFIDNGDPFPRICFKNTPLLTQLSCSLGSILENWHDFYDLLPQLVTLTLTLSKKLSVTNIPNFPVLINLKQMHIRLLSEDDNGFLLGGLPSFLFRDSPLYRLWSHLCRLLFRASPYLCRLSFDLGAYIPKHSLIENFPDHGFLEELEIHNFKGCKYEMELLTCIAGSCSSLQKIIIHPDSYETAVELLYLESTVKKMAAQKELEIVIKAPKTNNF